MCMKAVAILYNMEHRVFKNRLLYDVECAKKTTRHVQYYELLTYGFTAMREILQESMTFNQSNLWLAEVTIASQLVLISHGMCIINFIRWK